ncbi:MAG: response regulator [Rubrivivax sp.]|nr:response regulator [Rubrivivax sp.]
MSVRSQAGASAGTLRAARRFVWWLVVPVMALLAVLSLLQYGQRIDDAERDLLRMANERAQELEAIANPAMAHVHDLRRTLESRWNDPPDGGPELMAALGLRTHDGTPGGVPDGWSLDDAPLAQRQRFGQLWWAAPDGSSPDSLWLRRAQLFVEAARVVHQRAPGFEATWFAAAEANTSFGYPWVETPRMLQSMGVPSLQALDPRRQEGVARAERDLARDPKDTTFWGPPYVSQLNGELVQSHGAMVLVAGRYMGEVSLDFRLDALQRIAVGWQEAPARVWVVDRALNVLADATEPLRAPQGKGLADTRVHVPLFDRLPLALPDAERVALPTARRLLHHADGWVLAAAGREGSPWLYVQAVPQSALRAQVLPTLVPNAVLGLALLAVFVAGQWLFARWFVTPSLAVLGYLRQLSTDPAAPVPQLGERWRGWVDAVTETFQVQRTLQRRERAHDIFKSAMVDHAPIAIITTGGDGRIVDFNPAAEGMFGIPPAQALGRRLDEVILPPSRQGEARRVANSAGTTQGHHASGREFPMQLMTFRVQIDGEPFDTAFITDLSAQREAASQIDRQRDALRQSEKLSAMGTLLAGVAHELNNPLAIVMGRSSLLEEKAEGSGLEDDARRIREAAERCGRIVRTFLNMARQKPPSRSPVLLNEIVRAAADMLGYTLRSHGVQLELTLADGMPEVQADADQLGQVVLNLMVNAQQAMDSTHGARTLTLATGVEAQRPGPGSREPRVWLRVADSGPGVPQDVRSRLFEPFFTTKDAGFGTGLGLSVSRSIVREHGGELILEARAPEAENPVGASFRLSLPISGEASPSSVPVPLDTGSGELHSRVLVVDDEAEIADLMRAVLEGAGFDVATAESGAVALELLAEARFDAIVSDVRMPDLDGAALWRAVCVKQPHLARRLLFVTGDTLSQQARQVLEESGCASLDKPFAKADLLAAVRETLER